jgi:putative ABC transport system substrate-binding protein
MRRREFLELVAAAAVATPMPVLGQSRPVALIGYLASASPETSKNYHDAFLHALKEGGFIEGKNLTIEYRWAENHYGQLPKLVADLVTLQVAVIVATGGPTTALAAKAATSSIPIVFTAASDPVKQGLVSSLDYPGGNVTGSAMLTIELDPKRLELLHELLPNARHIGALVNPGRSDAAAQSKAITDSAQRLGLSATVLGITQEEELQPALLKLSETQDTALIVGADPFFHDKREEIISMAARHSLPAVYMSRDFVISGGLASYGPDISEGYRQAGVYVAEILKGKNPAELPVVQPTKMQLAFNLRTAKSLGLTIPSSLLARADEVIE